MGEYTDEYGYPHTPTSTASTLPASPVVTNSVDPEQAEDNLAQLFNVALEYTGPKQARKFNLSFYF